MWLKATRLLIGVFAHPVYGPIAKHLVRLGTAALVRSVRTTTRRHSVEHIS